MKEAPRSPQMVCFGVFEVDLGTGELRKKGLKIKIQEQPFEILAMLLARPGELVTREELRQKLWPADTFVDFEHGLNAAINKLREALGDSADNPRFVETLHRRGYRFIAPLDVPLTPTPSPLGRGRTQERTGEGAPEQIRRARKSGLRHRVALAGAAVIAAAVLGYWLTRPLPPPRVVSSIQLTNDGTAKSAPIFTDGSRLFFSAGELCQVSVAGGQPAPVSASITTPYLFRSPAGISPDGSELLVQSFQPGLVEGPLWVIPTIAGSAYRIGTVISSDASWSPDGQKMAYCTGNTLNLSRRDGSDSHVLATVAGTPYWVRWSPDGRVLRFTVYDPKTTIFGPSLAATASHSLWEVAPDGTNLHPLLPGWSNPAAECCGSWTPDGKYYVFQSGHNNRSDIWAIREKARLFGNRKREPAQLTSGPLNLLGPALSKDGKKLFAIGSQPRGELVRYDVKSGEFVPYLGGISADTVDFSRDGQWITYVACPEGTLWRSKLDGSERLQLTFPPLTAYLPRWSPDAKQIAFQAATPGRAWTMYLVSAEGGPLQEVATGNGNLGWTADGRSLVYSERAPSMQPGVAGKSTIQLMDLKTHQISTLPDSEGLYSPRVSPDGRYIAALRSGPEVLLVFDLAAQKWIELVPKPVVNYPSWSRDSRYIYFDSSESDSGVYRVRVSDRKLERLASLKGVRRTGGVWMWCGLAPDDSPLVLRDTGTQEIYALDVDFP